MKTPPNFIDLTGQRFGRLVAVERIANRGECVRYRFQCDCGQIHDADSSHVRKGHIKSCGCWNREVAEKTNLSHGHTVGQHPTRAYRAWVNMISRCENPRAASFEQYGAKGVKICKRWRQSFETFLADIGDPPQGMSLDRLDPTGNYEPSNCRWATPKQQSRNRRSTIYVEHEGARLTLKEYAATLGVGYSYLASLVREGQSPVDAAMQITSKPRYQNRLHASSF